MNRTESRKRRKKHSSASQAIVVFDRNDSAGSVFWFCFSHHFFFFYSKPLIFSSYSYLVSEKKLNGGRCRVKKTLEIEVIGKRLHLGRT